jgi:hypothetical protein
MKETTKARIEELKARAVKEAAEREAEIAILQELPAETSAPLVSSVGNAYPEGVYATVNFTGPSYDPEKTFDPVAILREIEAAGWKPLPATLTKRADYRPSPEPGLQDDLPEVRNRNKLTDSWPICPLWFVPEQYCGSHARAFYRTPSGKLVCVHVRTPAAACSLAARRIEYRGGWRLDRTSGQLSHPDRWHEIRTPDGEPVAQKAASSHAVVDTEQGMSGAMYWEPNTDHADFPMTPADMLAYLLAALEK